MKKGANPRFVVTSISKKEVDADTVYEQLYCARGDIENRIKEQQLYLFADRTSTSKQNTENMKGVVIAYDKKSQI